MAGRVKTIVIGETAGTGARYAVGPVFTDKTVQAIADMIGAAGDRVVGPIPLISLEDFRATPGGVR
jgi:hypothetical protein